MNWKRAFAHAYSRFFARRGRVNHTTLSRISYIEPSSPFEFHVQRLSANPIVHRHMAGFLGAQGDNINGPSLIRVPGWVRSPLAKYYLFFAHHKGSFIRLAYADALEGPWEIHAGGVLRMETTPCFRNHSKDHVASPDVHIDDGNHRIIMYYHGMGLSGRRSLCRQMTFVATSKDGLEFESMRHELGCFYFRVFKHFDGLYYGIAKYEDDGGILYRSSDGISDWERGPSILPRMRHAALWLNDGMLYVFFSRGGDAPEHLIVSRVENLDADWHKWRFTEPQTVLRPELEWEGAGKPIEVSRFGPVYQLVHELRDPAIYQESGRLFLLYSAGGERSLGIVEIRLEA